MKKLFVLFASAALALTAASCEKESANGTVEGSEKATLTIRLSAQKSGVGGTRAPQPDSDFAASPAESKVQTVDVFVFNADGSAASQGSHSHVDIATANQTNANHNLAAITTTDGAKRIYVAINLPASMQKEYSIENNLLNEVQTAAQLSVAEKFVMFSEASVATLVKAEGGQVNNLNVDCRRVVSKIVASKLPSAPDWTVTWPSNNLRIAYSVEQYQLFNRAANSYVAPHIIAGTRSTTGTYMPLGAAVTTVPTTPTTDSGILALDGEYVCENIPAAALASQTTGATVKVTASVTGATKLNAGGTDIDATLDPVTYGGGSTDIYVFHSNLTGIDYVTNAAHRTSINDFLVARDGAANISMAQYVSGAVYFNTYFNKAGANDYKIGRNEFIHFEMKGVKGIDGDFTGTPTVVTPPEEPIDGVDASLIIAVTVKPWLYKYNDQLL